MRPWAWKDLLKWNAGERNESLIRCVTHSRSQDKGLSCTDWAAPPSALHLDPALNVFTQTWTEYFWGISNFGAFSAYLLHLNFYFFLNTCHLLFNLLFCWQQILLALQCIHLKDLILLILVAEKEYTSHSHFTLHKVSVTCFNFYQRV